MPKAKTIQTHLKNLPLHGATVAGRNNGVCRSEKLAPHCGATGPTANVPLVWNDTIRQINARPASVSDDGHNLFVVDWFVGHQRQQQQQLLPLISTIAPAHMNRRPCTLAGPVRVPYARSSRVAFCFNRLQAVATLAVQFATRRRRLADDARRLRAENGCKPW